LLTNINHAIGSPEPSIPFNKPLILGTELRYVAEAIASGQVDSDGRFTRRCAEILEERFAIPRVLMVPSCTAALEMAAMLCELGPGDEVIVPSYTFVSTALAIVRLGARPVFVEIRPDTLTLDAARIEAAITARTRAIFSVHYTGVACDMDRILATARTYGLRVVEDAAQGVNAFYKGKALGSMGDLGTYSFHSTKNLLCGEGGALCCNDAALIERAEILRDKGTNRARFFRGEVDQYTWVDVGSSYIPSELACAFLAAQLEAMDAIKVRRKAIDDFYREHLAALAEEGLFRLPCVPPECETHHAGFHIVLNDGPTRDALMAHLKEHGISAVFHFVPLHTSPMGLRLGYREGDLPITEDLSGRLLRLPAFAAITRAEQGRVVDHVAAFLRRTPWDCATVYSFGSALSLTGEVHR
jgi:dTDP-4-amino-4,6-dideoxygalactose transaminase